MATLVLTALGTAIGGPLGGAIGGLVGSQLDRAIIGGSHRDGPRLKELAVTTSSYGTPVPRHFGTMRVAGTIVWATDLVETSERSGGGKGAPSTTSYNYSASFAVALASRPILRVGRIWADGNLLRGAAGDLKTGGQLRVYTGHGDQPCDPLIAADLGGACPAFRGLAYCVFESLQLADFGNRIPALTFELTADDGEIALATIVETMSEGAALERPLTGLVGFSDEGGPLANALATLDQLYPIACDAGGEALSLTASDAAPGAAPLLPPAAIDESEEGFGAATGTAQRRRAAASNVPNALRYYDLARDYQPGIQRVEGRSRPGRGNTLEFPGAVEATVARKLVDSAAARASSARETLSWRMAELDPALTPGTAVRVPDHRGIWSIDAWEWRQQGIELELRRLPAVVGAAPAADAGAALPKPDRIAGPTRLVAFELPWDGHGAADVRQAFAAVSSGSEGWTGAALYLDQAGQLLPIGTSGPRRSVIGSTATFVAPSRAILLERAAGFEVELAAPQFELVAATPEQLARGANRAVIGNEVIQFARPSHIGGARWRIEGLLRGRGGSEAAAAAGHPVGTAFVLLDGAPVALDPAAMNPGEETTIAAIGLADSAPVMDAVRNSGATARPLTPVHPRAAWSPDGSLTLSWLRRARGAWTWTDGIEVPLNEEAARYLVGLGDTELPFVRWELGEPRLTLSASALDEMRTIHPGQPLWVRQIGRIAASEPLLLTTLD